MCAARYRIAFRTTSESQSTAETRSDTGYSNVLLDSAAGFVVSNTKLRSFFGSSQQSVPVEPL
jgi:hypothetical protein